MWEKIKLRWKQEWCLHHWHTIEGSHRKVKTKKPYCERWTGNKKKYAMTDGFDRYFIKTKHIEECCKCGKKCIVSDLADIIGKHIEEMFYPDIDDEPLEV